ncbi:flap endonuclease-1 [Candidatus Woesearchaeota archaeon CG10_big_fil_rev_8_21_14_0_10_34_8]|nr:MAG: flap endonuclease-1 [Candidatus Woesearchaeota archaeon CG10_big_fil_rev_8_21_14_0_10_34_8]
MGLQFKDLVQGQDIQLKDLADKKIAIDTFNILYQFLASIRGHDGNPLTDSKGNVTSHLIGLFSRTTKLMQHNIKLIFVFDGKPPELKTIERQRRRKLKEEAIEQYEIAKEREDIAAMKKYAARTTVLTSDMIIDAKMLITALGFPIVDAASEGEAQVAYIVNQGDADYGSSQDYDTLLYGVPKLIRNLSIAGKRKKAGVHSYFTIQPQLVKTQDVLNNLGLDKEQLIVLAILVGTDYNKAGIKGIGPNKALKLVKEYKKDFDKLFEAAKWEEHYDFSWKDIYELIINMPVNKNYNIKFNSFDTEKIVNLLCNNHDFTEERVRNSLEKLEKLNVNKKQKGLGDFF